MHKHLILCSVSILATAACAGSQAEQVKDARMEQTEANATASEQAVEQNSVAREESIDRAHDATEENIEAANAPGEGATEELAEVSKDRATYQSEAETKVDKLGVELDAAAQKLSVLGGRAPTSLKSQLTTATQEYKMLKQDVQTLDKTPTTAWESTTSKIDDRIAALDDRIDDLTESIESV